MTHLSSSVYSDFFLRLKKTRYLYVIVQVQNQNNIIWLEEKPPNVLGTDKLKLYCIMINPSFNLEDGITRYLYNTRNVFFSTDLKIIDF